jgi:predicted nuclease with TOPRIM domain
MSLFKERQASAKKLIQLQNEILALKAQLQDSQQSVSQPCEDCADCEDCSGLVQQIQSILDARNEELSLLQDEVSALKGDLKKIRSENTRLKNKLSKEPEDV